MYRFEIYCHNDEWSWQLWSPFNRVIAVSLTSYSSSALCEREVAIIKDEVRLTQANFEIFRDERDENSEIWRWRFRSSHNQVMAISPTGYPSYALCERAIGIFTEKAHYAQINPGNYSEAAHTAAP